MTIIANELQLIVYPQFRESQEAEEKILLEPSGFLTFGVGPDTMEVNKTGRKGADAVEKTRNTRQKKLILSLLEEAGEPLTAGEIYTRAVRRQPTMAKSTVYRNLEAMQARGEVVRGRLENGESFYGVAHGRGHCHYMICKGCNRMLDLPACPLANMEREIARTAGFTVTDHVLQIYGYCADCRRKNACGDGQENNERSWKDRQ